MRLGRSQLASTPVRAAFALLLAVSDAGLARAVESDNHELVAVPAPGTVRVDGDLTDWDWSGRIVVCRDVAHQLGRYSAEVAMMHDAQALYVGVDWRDPTPMVNNYDPRFDVDLRRCFHSDSLQLHLRTDLERKVIGWFYTKDAVPAVCALDGWFPWHDDRPIPYIDGIRNLGISEAFRVRADGTGYTQELRIPWSAMTGTGRPIAAGDGFDCMLDLVWGPESGKGWPVNHMMDLVAPGAAHSGWFWEVNRIYGRVRLSPTGRLSLSEPEFLQAARQSRERLQPTEGPVDLAYRMPFDGFATLVVEDEHGRRVRNLVGMAPRASGSRIEHWDCRDDAGTLVAPGRYRYRGLLHAGIEPVYAATYGTPGSPPWDTADGRGAWMSDHCAPRAVAASGGRIALGAERAESGWSLIVTDLDGRKLWGDAGLAGIDALGADAEHIYVFLRAWDTAPALARVDARTGRYAPFETPDGPRLKVPVFPAAARYPWTGGFAACSNALALSIVDTNGLCGVRFYDPRTAAVTGETPLPAPGALAFDAAGTLHAVSSGRVVRLTRAGVETVVAQAPVSAGALAVGPDGSLFVVDRPSSQVRVYGADGRATGVVGAPGGRPPRGTWRPDGLLDPAAVAVDARGRLWVAENDVAPKRVSLWTANGELVRDFIGPTQYGGGGANADPDNATRVFGSGCEFRLDPAAGQARVVAALGDCGGQLMKAGGREYVMSKAGRLYLRTNDALRVVGAMGRVCWKDYGEQSWLPLPPAPRGTHGYASLSYVWSDRNDDGRPDREELVCGSFWTGWTNGLAYPVGVSGYFGSYWLDENFNLYGVAGESHGAYGGRPTMVTRIPLAGWSPGGAPLWDTRAQRVLADGGRVDGCLYLPAGGTVIAGAPITGLRDDGTIAWTYPDAWPGVHASHHAALPERDDVLVGTLGCIGRASSAVGTVFAMHSNMGRLYLMTTDGLLVASVFQDCRLGGDAWPRDAVPGAPLGGVTLGSEWFGGHFFRSVRDGACYLIAGFTAYNLIRLDGFDSLRAIRGGTFEVSDRDLAAAERLAQHRTAVAGRPPPLAISLLPQPPPLDGALSGFPTNRFVSWSSGPYRVRAALAVASTNLYLAFDVSGDENPMINGGKDVNQLFTTGDSVDLQIATDPSAGTNRTEAVVGDLRLLLSVFEKRPVAVLYRWKAPAGAVRAPVTFRCPWRSATVERVEVLDHARIVIRRRTGGYTLEAAVPLSDLGLAAREGAEYALDLGVVFSDAKGDNRAARVYWSNKATGLTADVPGEILPTPQLWGRGRVVR